MPDISMCTHATCPLRQSCYRHAESGTVPFPQQGYMLWEPEFGFNPGMTPAVICEGYIQAELKP